MRIIQYKEITFQTVVFRVKFLVVCEKGKSN